MTEAEKAYQYFVIAVPENEEQAKAYFWARKALRITLTPPNEWVSVEERLPEEKQRVIVRCEHVGTSVGWILWGKWMTDIGPHAGDVTHWMLLPAPPGKDNNVPTKAQNDDFHYIGIMAATDYCPNCGAKMDKEENNG